MRCEAEPDAAAQAVRATLQAAVERHQRGDYAGAERLYREVLARQPDHFDACHLLGVALLQTGRLEDGRALIARAIALKPTVGAAHSNLAMALMGLGRNAEALASLDQAIALQPQVAESHNNRGIALANLGRQSDALTSYDAALARNPAYPEAHNNRGTALLALGQPAEALAAFEAAVTARPDYPEAHGNRGLALNQLRRLPEAVAAFDRALGLKPDFAEAQQGRGVALAMLERPAEALASLDAAIGLQPTALAYSYRGNVLCALKRLDEALASHDRAVELDAQNHEAHHNRGFTLQAMSRPAEAVASYQAALNLHPDNPDILNNLGNSLQDLGDAGGALAAYDRAIALKPDHADAPMNKALVLLRLGRLEEGWPLYEWRKAKWPGVSRADLPQPTWTGVESLASKTLLLRREQGLGDTLQFCRYALACRDRGAQVILSVQPPLVRLLRQLEPQVRVISEGAAPGAFDLHAALMSLPLAFGTTLETIPAGPQLVAEPALTALWAKRLGPKTRPRIGLAWSGSAAHVNDRNRSLSLQQLLPLLSDDVAWISLQKELRDADAAALESQPRIRSFAGHLTDFAETAALIEQLDLVITVDTSVAHLAAAMGKPTWILLPLNPDFRWLAGRDDSPWYPSVRLFRQPRFGDWAAVIGDVASELAARFA
ncbi:MAG: repeat-containing protein [Phenylobacterium sp.]|nr:repeat-containing protein [Phenylobacterium sp.]